MARDRIHHHARKAAHRSSVNSFETRAIALWERHVKDPHRSIIRNYFNAWMREDARDCARQLVMLKQMIEPLHALVGPCMTADPTSRFPCRYCTTPVLLVRLLCGVCLYGTEGKEKAARRSLYDAHYYERYMREVHGIREGDKGYTI